MMCFRVSDRTSFLPLLLWMVTIFVCGSSTAASGQSIAVGSQASSLGIGPEVTLQLNAEFNLRGGASYLYFHRRGLTQQTVNVRYDAKVHLAAIRLFLDWHPFDNAFRISAGGVYNRSRAEVQASPAESFTFDGRSFSPEELGQISGSASFSNAIHPYLGLGFGNSVRGSSLDVFTDIGAMYVGRPHVEMSGDGLIKGTANHDSTLNEGFRSFQLLPYVSLGISIDL